MRVESCEIDREPGSDFLEKAILFLGLKPKEPTTQVLGGWLQSGLESSSVSVTHRTPASSACLAGAFVAVRSQSIRIGLAI